jgi:dihydropyrimidine dehydrogenase (NAD+) subunit PreA
MALGAGNVQVCTAAMTYGFKIVQEMITGLSELDGRQGPSRPRRHLRPRRAKRHRLAVSQPQLHRQGAYRPGQACIKCGRCHIACEDTSHQAITQFVDGVRHFEVMEDECVGCNLCVNVCPVENCITMVGLEPGVLDQRTGKPVDPNYANWTTHPNNPMAKQAAE